MRLPAFAPSNWNCTLATPTLSEAFAVTLTVPETVLPAAGEVIETVGGVVSDPGGGVVLLLPPLTKPAHPAKLKLARANKFSAEKLFIRFCRAVERTSVNMSMSPRGWRGLLQPVQAAADRSPTHKSLRTHSESRNWTQGAKRGSNAYRLGTVRLGSKTEVRSWALAK